jgi:hypothetical protein
VAQQEEPRVQAAHGLVASHADQRARQAAQLQRGRMGQVQFRLEGQGTRLGPADCPRQDEPGEAGRVTIQRLEQVFKLPSKLQETCRWLGMQRLVGQAPHHQLRQGHQLRKDYEM